VSIPHEQKKKNVNIEEDFINPRRNMREFLLIIETVNIKCGMTSSLKTKEMRPQLPLVNC
jgi:hypothetical protein